MINVHKQFDQKDARSGFGEGLVEVAKQNSNIVALCCDLVSSLKMEEFIKENPNRFFQVGIAEANMIGIAAGLTIGGKIPFTATFANFSTGRVYDQIRQSIVYSNKNVKICASHAGLTLGEDGATHQILEDIGLMKMLPNMTVINTCDFNQTKAATIAISKYEGPVYLRFGRPILPVFFPEKLPFQIGKGVILRNSINNSVDITIVTTGYLVWETLLAADELSKIDKIECEVINIHTIKPLDENIILNSIKKTRRIVTVEEHNIFGGLGESISRLLVQKYPIKQGFVAVQDSFGESGTSVQLLKKYKIDKNSIIEKVKEQF